jgi:hypothetical protein
VVVRARSDNRHTRVTPIADSLIPWLIL